MKAKDSFKVFSPEWIQLMGNRYNSRPKFQWPWPYFVATDSMFEPLRERVEDLVASLPTNSQARAITRLRAESFWETYHELSIGRLLEAGGLRTEYEPNLGGLTPDWYVSARDGSQQFIVEVFTQNIPMSKRAEESRMANLIHRLDQIPLDVFITISLNPNLRKEPLTSQRVKTIYSEVRKWLEGESSEEGSELHCDEFSFCVRLRHQGYPSLMHGRGKDPCFAPNKLRENIEAKMHRYKTLLETNQIPFVVAVMPGLEMRSELCSDEMKDIVLGERSSFGRMKGLFANEPWLSGAIFAQCQGSVEWRFEYYVNPAAKFPLPKDIFTKPLEGTSPSSKIV